MKKQKLNIPDDIYSSAEYVMNRAKHVSIDASKLLALAKLVRSQFNRGFGTVEEAFGTAGNLEKDVNLLFFETATNFCFWSQDPKNKWKVKHGNNISGGWYGLRNVYMRAIDNGIPVFDASYMSQLSMDKGEEIFRGEADIRIPLLEQRVNNIVESANYLIHHHSGSALRFVENCMFDAPTIAQTMTSALTSYRDGAIYDGRWVWILKRAQIFPNDLSQLESMYPEFTIKNKDKLTIFADYKLPQLLRYAGVLKYTKELSFRVDNQQLISSCSEEEVEIRMATILACKKLGEMCPDISIADIDVSLWLISKRPDIDEKMSPHHMTVSNFY